MRILEGTNVDLIEPFPTSQVQRAVGWLHCYKTLVTTDDGPQTDEDFAHCLMEMITRPTTRSWGLIDKHNKLNIHHEAPLVGFIIFERTGRRNGYCHIATTRRAWGSGLIDEAIRIGMVDTFESDPDLLRISTFVMNTNSPARALLKRIGFVYEGTLRDYSMQNGEPRPISHFGITRREWEAQQNPVPVEPESESIEA